MPRCARLLSGSAVRRSNSYAIHTIRNVLAIWAFVGIAHAFDITQSDNTMAYWGQGQNEKSIGVYCDDDSIDTLAIAFLANYFDTGHLPSLQLMYNCGGAVFPGSSLVNCGGTFADDIKKCQAKGKAVTLTIGGSPQPPSNAFTSESVASAFADQLWNLFLGGVSTTRPFGDVQLDGINFNMADATKLSNIGAFISRLQTHYKSAPKKYITTIDLSCLLPNSGEWEPLGQTLNSTPVDALYIRMFNEGPCSLSSYNTDGWNFDVWNKWASTQAPNKDVKLYISAVASPDLSPSDYLPPEDLAQIANSMRAQYPKNFGGVAYWDAFGAVANNKFNVALKTALVNPPLSTTTVATTSASVSGTDISPSSPSSESAPLSSPSTSQIHAPASSFNPAIIAAIIIPIVVVGSLLLLFILLRRRRGRKRVQDAIFADESPYVPSGFSSLVGGKVASGAGQMRQPVVDSVHPFIVAPGPVSSSDSYAASSKRMHEKPLPLQPTSAVDAATGSSNMGSSQSEDAPVQFAVLQNEMGRVGMSMQALLSSLARLGDPLPHDTRADEAGTELPPPQYDHS